MITLPVEIWDHVVQYLALQDHKAKASLQRLSETSRLHRAVCGRYLFASVRLPSSLQSVLDDQDSLGRYSDYIETLHLIGHNKNRMYSASDTITQLDGFSRLRSLKLSNQKFRELEFRSLVDFLVSSTSLIEDLVMLEIGYDLLLVTDKKTCSKGFTRLCNLTLNTSTDVSRYFIEACSLSPSLHSFTLLHGEMNNPYFLEAFAFPNLRVLTLHGQRLLGIGGFCDRHPTITEYISTINHTMSSHALPNLRSVTTSGSMAKALVSGRPISQISLIDNNAPWKFIRCILPLTTANTMTKLVWSSRTRSRLSNDEIDDLIELLRMYPQLQSLEVRFKELHKQLFDEIFKLGHLQTLVLGYDVSNLFEASRDFRRQFSNYLATKSTSCPRLSHVLWTLTGWWDEHTLNYGFTKIGCEWASAPDGWSTFNSGQIARLIEFLSSLD